MVHEIERASTTLKESAAPASDRTMTLTFLAHFVGGINQSLHIVMNVRDTLVFLLAILIAREERLPADQSSRRTGFRIDPLTLPR